MTEFNHIKAASARINGVFDDPDLMAFGPLTADVSADVAAIYAAGAKRFYSTEAEVEAARAQAKLGRDHMIAALEAGLGQGEALNILCERFGEADKALKAKAQDVYHSDDIEIDDHALISHADDGTWVNAWLWVPKDVP